MLLKVVFTKRSYYKLKKYKNKRMEGTEKKRNGEIEKKEKIKENFVKKNIYIYIVGSPFITKYKQF